MKKSQQENQTALATFSGGCFWCMESPFEKHIGVYEVISGYTGGHVENPTYEQVSSGTSGHIESVQIHYNPKVISYEELLDIFWRQIDPTDADGQFVDRGFQYTTAIWYHDNEQKELAEKSKKTLDESGRYDNKVITPINPAAPFYEAEEYHQNYYKTHTVKYKFYRYLSGRDKFLNTIWNHTDKLSTELTPIQYKVTQLNGTEPAFNNEYWDNKEAGIYVDLISGEPLFSSIDKYESGTGWPSFTKPLDKQNIVEQEDRSLFSIRTEVRGKNSDSHLGHVFDDGPQPTGKRYCMNSASLRFVPVDKLEEEGYGEYVSLFN